MINGFSAGSVFSAVKEISACDYPIIDIKLYISNCKRGRNTG